MRRRLFNLFAFACLAFAIYLIAFTKEDVNPTPTGQTISAATGSKAVAHNN
jgi:hypothetical protein